MSRLTLHEEVEVGSSELLMDGLQQDVLPLSALRGSLLSFCCSLDGQQQRRLELRGVREAEGRAVNQAVQSDEGQRDGDGVSQVMPTVSEDRDVGNDTEQRFGRPERKSRSVETDHMSAST